MYFKLKMRKTKFITTKRLGHVLIQYNLYKDECNAKRVKGPRNLPNITIVQFRKNDHVVAE